MAEEKSSGVSWEAALYIWWNEIWRFAAINVGAGLFIYFASKLTPVVHKFLFDLSIAYEGPTLIGLLFVELYIHLWVVKKSFVDRYPTFTFAAVSKSSTRSALGFDKQLKTNDLLAVWWNQLWRMLLIPGSIAAGVLYSELTKHPTAANYAHLLMYSKLTPISLYAAIVLSVWATKESLGDHYRTFRFTSEPKTFYKKAAGMAPGPKNYR